MLWRLDRLDYAKEYTEILTLAAIEGTSTMLLLSLVAIILCTPKDSFSEYSIPTVSFSEDTVVRNKVCFLVDQSLFTICSNNA